MKSIFRLTLVGLLLGVPTVCGQVAREAVTSVVPYQATGETGRITIDSSSPSTVTWKVLTGAFAGATASATMPFDVPGAAVHIGGKVFLAPGKNSTNGHGIITVLSLQDSPRQISVAATVDYGNLFDPFRVLWNSAEAQLYVYDFSQRRVLGAPFSGTSLPGAATFLVAANTQQAPVLGRARYTVYLEATDGSAPGVEVVDSGDPTTFDLIRPVAQGVWVVDPGLSRGPSPRTRWSVENIARINALGPIRVGGIVGTCQLRERVFTNAVMGEVNVTSTSGYFEIPLPSDGLVPGLFYEIGSSAATPTGEPHGFTALVRHGVPQESTQVEMPIGLLGATGCWIGNAAFTVVGTVRSGANQPTPIDVTMFLWIGARHSDGSDPVVDVNGVKVLSEILAIAGPYSVTVADKTVHGPLHVPQPIPNDQNLVGGVILWQWCGVTAGGSITLSDVFGAMITEPWPVPPTAASRSSGSSALSALRGTYPRVPARARTAAAAWLGSVTNWKPEGQKLEIWRRALGR